MRSFVLRVKGDPFIHLACCIYGNLQSENYTDNR